MTGISIRRGRHGSSSGVRVSRCGRSQRLRIFLMASSLAWAAAATIVSAQQEKPSEYQIKAVYLFNFGKFVRWPVVGLPAEGGAFSICVLGQDPFGERLDSTIAGEAIDGRRLVAKRASKLEDVAGCRILYISASESNQLKKILGALTGTPTLTVSDIPDFTTSGGMIQFVVKENKVRFEVNLAAAEKSGLVLSSQLLKVATTVRKDSRGGDHNP
jgi:hypothetical protein